MQRYENPQIVRGLLKKIAGDEYFYVLKINIFNVQLHFGMVFMP
ncbi:hypothetical protein IMSAGC014_00377 [Bacteroidaceae bacterium]|nr:hypothetical protein IMSAGC014_00377 [Bacteroidaceae bacterium]